MKKISIGSWAYCFGPYQDNPVDFHTVLHKLQDLGLEGVELGGFPPHPSPDSHATQDKRRALAQEVKDHGLEFSGLAANLWMHKLVSVEDSGPMISEFAKNLFFAEDLGIDCIRVDSLEGPDVFDDNRKFFRRHRSPIHATTPLPEDIDSAHPRQLRPATAEESAAGPPSFPDAICGQPPASGRWGRTSPAGRRRTTDRTGQSIPPIRRTGWPA